MKGSYTYDYPRPMLTADCVVVRGVGEAREVLLVLRGGEPCRGCWALPGGFMEMDETLEHCAVRELREETGLRVDEGALRLVGVFSRVDRDPRGRTVTGAYLVENGERRTENAVAGDDAAAVRWWPLRELPPLAFDHREVVDAARKMLDQNGE